MTLQPLLTLVIAAKSPDPLQLQRCLASAAALRNAMRLDVVIVLSGRGTQISPELKAVFGSFNILEVTAAGIYPAYNAGITAARADHILFLGVDDILLPALEAVLDKLESSLRDYHLVAAACHMQDKGIVRPKRWKPSLVFHNWCHQGLIYSRHYLVQHPYDVRYRIRADHVCNINLVSDPSLRWIVLPQVISYFSSGGASFLQADVQFRLDFPALAARAYGVPYGLVVHLRQWLADKLYGNLSARGLK